MPAEATSGRADTPPDRVPRSHAALVGSGCDTGPMFGNDHDATWHYEQLKPVKEFTVTQEHLTLARLVNIDWLATEWAAAPGST